MAARVVLVEIRAQHIDDDVAQATDDAVVVQALHVVERAVDAQRDRLGVMLEMLGALRIVQYVELFDQQPGEIGIARQCLLDIVLAEGETSLAQEFRERAQERHVPPGEAGGQHQPVESVAFGVARNHGVECVFQRLLDVLELGRAFVGALHHEVEHGRLMRPAIDHLQRDGE